MKSIYVLSAAVASAAVILTASCQKDGGQFSISVEPAGIEAPYEGGTYQAQVTSNGAWTAVADSEHITVTPSSGNGNTPITVTIGTNPLEDAVYTCDIVFSAADGGAVTATVKVTQEGLEIPDPEITIDPASIEVPRTGGSYEIAVTANSTWTAVSEDSFVTVSPESGEGDGTVTVTVAENSSEEALTTSVLFTCTTEGKVPQETELTVSQEAGLPEGVIEYGGVQYRTAVMGDGRTWMVDNLRYIPEDMTVSSDPADASGLWYPNLGGEVALTDEESITAYGYLYSPFLAMGITADDINADNYLSFEGTQGICPDGWHIPTQAEAEALVNAYWTEEQKGAAVELLDEAGFNTTLGGFVQRNNSGATGKYAKAMQGYILLSTGDTYKVEDGVITSTNKGLMKTVTSTYNRFTVAKLQNYGGANVRCIKDAE